jgi:hypothetical protein
MVAVPGDRSADQGADETKPTIPLTTPIRDAKGLLTYMGSDGRRYVVFGEPPGDEELQRPGSI